MNAGKRYASRAVLITSDNQILLMRMAFPWDTEHKWILPGGQIEPNETAIEACRRELWEETGLNETSNLHHIWKRDFFLPKANVHLCQQYFWIDIEKFEPSPAKLTAEENEWFRGFRWWTTEQLQTTEAYFEPELLVEGVTNIRENGIPDEPYDIDRLTSDSIDLLGACGSAPHV